MSTSINGGIVRVVELILFIDIVEIMSIAQEIDRKLIKTSNVRLVVSGNNYEVYDYQLPYFYNWSPIADTHQTRTTKSSPSMERRKDNLYRARKNIRRIIFANQEAWYNELKFFTFTFAENEQNIQRAYGEWSKFTKRFNRALSTRGYNSAKYIAITEFQKRGAIHFHVLYFNLPRLSSIGIDVSTLWGKGFIQARPISKVRSVGAYVCKYLQKDLVDPRLCGRKAYFTSRGLEKPFEIRKLSTVDNFLQNTILETTYENVYMTSKYGFVRYRQLIARKESYVSNITRPSSFAISAGG